MDGATFHTFDKLPSDDDDVWLHVVINYFGVEEGQGFLVYFNGDKVTDENSERTEDDTPAAKSSGRIVIGRSFIEDDNHYASMVMDEVTMFDSSLKSEHINILYSY